MIGENPQVTEKIVSGISFIDVKWSYEFAGHKSERTKIINHLKKNGYVYYNDYYIKII
jgi:hypothetical protein